MLEGIRGYSLSLEGTDTPLVPSPHRPKEHVCSLQKRCFGAQEFFQNMNGKHSWERQLCLPRNLLPLPCCFEWLLRSAHSIALKRIPKETSQDH